ncbi:elongation factor G [Chloracidobacterium sp. S]|uniref:elongation factor G n=1 Tax=Chloracidobacterium aggregatum TaxID=2851959 RepID=UPI001B8C406D|nr:elongation factor G [Chloracidobacterium aggregatum]QUV87509.1 elongation factor G [Chloracidobacterium sp. S]
MRHESFRHPSPTQRRPRWSWSRRQDFTCCGDALRHGATPRLGKVADGTALTDFDEIAIAHQLSTQTGVAHGVWRDHKLNLLDTPGATAFILDSRLALRAAETALIVLDAHNGVEIGTETVRQYAAEFNLPCFVFINKLDKEQTDVESCLQALTEQCDLRPVLLQIPIGIEKQFRGLVDVVRQRAFLYQTDGSGAFVETDVPANLQTAVAKAREALIERVAESDDRLLETFFEQGTLTDEQVLAGLPAAIQSQSLTPVFLGSATLNIGIPQLLDALVSIAPDPAHVGGWLGMSPLDDHLVSPRHVTDDEPFAGYVFKTLDEQFNRISLCKIISGVLRPDSLVVNGSRGALEKVAALYTLQGRQLDKLTEAHAGDIIALTKLKDTHTGDTLCDKAAPVRFAPVTMPEPAISFAIEPKSRADEDKLSGAMLRIIEQDGTLRYARDPQTKEFILSGTNQQHIELTVERLRVRYGVEVVIHAPKVPYLETFKGRVEVHARHKKQTGGRGQFGDCKCIFEALPHGAGFRFVDKIVGGVIPQQFRPAVEKGILEAAEHGALAGYPVVDFQVELVDGSYHTVDSDELSFKLAGRKAFRAAMEKVKLALLEPIMHVVVSVPNEFAGDAMSDLSTRRGRILGINAKGTRQIVEAHVPLGEMLTYATALNSLTSGRGSYTMRFAHYDEAPPQVTQRVVAEAQAAGRIRALEEV